MEVAQKNHLTVKPIDRRSFAAILGDCGRRRRLRLLAIGSDRRRLFNFQRNDSTISTNWERLLDRKAIWRFVQHFERIVDDHRRSTSW